MSDTQSATGNPNPERAALMSALFAQLVMQQTNMALMLLGKVVHPETGKVVKDLEAARLFIDELEMLEVKTKGNLTKEETGLLKQSLMSLRLAFVQAVEEPKSPEAKAPSAAAGHPEHGAAASDSPAAPTSDETEDERRKKFSKKY